MSEKTISRKPLQTDAAQPPPPFSPPETQQQLTQEKHEWKQPVVERTRSRSSSASSSNAGSRSTSKQDVFYIDPNNLTGSHSGKTSGWYHGIKYDLNDMWLAALKRDTVTLRKCLKAGLSANYCRWSKPGVSIGAGIRSLADVAARYNDVTTMRLLREYGADMTGAASAASSVPISHHFYFNVPQAALNLIKNDTWTTPLLQACRFGHMDVVNLLLNEAQVDPDQRDMRRRTALLIAAGGPVLNLARTLLDRGASIDATDVSGVTPLAQAAYSGRLEMVELLLERGAKIDLADRDHETPLHNAALRRHFDVVAALIAWGADVDLKNHNGASAFFLAASNFKGDTMDALARYGADTDSRDKFGCTALLRAVFARNLPLVEHLLQLGVDIDAQDYDGWSPLFGAMILNDKDMISLLLANGADVWKPDIQGDTVLHQAATLGSVPVVRRIVAAHAGRAMNHDSVNMSGETALTLACTYNNNAIVKLLLKHGASSECLDSNGYGALDRAMYWGAHACVRHLLESGATIEDKNIQMLRHGYFDRPGFGQHRVIFNHLRQPYQPPAPIIDKHGHRLQPRDLFARTVNIASLTRRMLEKQGKTPSPTATSTTVPSTSIDTKPGSVSAASGKPTDTSNTITAATDPFETCTPKAFLSSLNQDSTSNGTGKNVATGGAIAVAAAAHTVDVALNIANVLSSI